MPAAFALDAAAADRITRPLAVELEVRPAQVPATVARLDGGATVPFIARDRKAASSGPDGANWRTGDIVKVRVLDGNLPRGRIGR